MCTARLRPNSRTALRRSRARTEGSKMRPYHVAIVGSGPSGFFASASLLKAADTSEEIDVAVDMLEMLPTPGDWSARASRPTTPRSSRSARPSRRPPKTPIPLLREPGGR